MKIRFITDYQHCGDHYTIGDVGELPSDIADHLVETGNAEVVFDPTPDQPKVLQVQKSKSDEK